MRSGCPAPRPSRYLRVEVSRIGGYGDSVMELDHNLGRVVEAVQEAIFNIEADPREKRALTIDNTWVVRPYSMIVGEYLASLQDHPNPPPANMTRF